MSGNDIAFVLWNADSAASSTAGDPVGEWQATGVSIDTRTLKPGDLFVAIQGVASDGHAHAEKALEMGAAAVVVRHDSDAVPTDASAVRVVDTTKALEDLGRAARARSRAQIVGITGSVGKTGTKEALRSVFQRHGITHASEGNLNNHWGLPLTLARMPVEAKFAALEMGMNHAGEIKSLTEMARPHVALITTVEEVHSEYFDGTEGIADAKSEIFLGLENGGTAVLNRDNPYFDRMQEAAKAADAGRILSFGQHEASDIRLTEHRLEAQGSCAKVDVMGEAVHYRIGVPGRHWIQNSLGVLAVAAAMDLDLKVAAAMFARLTSPKGRGDFQTVKLPDGAFTLIDESYNASPPAMRAAFDVLAKSEPTETGRRIAVLGDMLELGDRADDLHRQLMDHLAGRDIDIVYAAGGHMAALYDSLPMEMRGGHFADAETMIPAITDVVGPGDVVLVKGSNGSRMASVVLALQAIDADAEASCKPVDGK